MRQLLAGVLVSALTVATAQAAPPDDWWRSGGSRLRPQDARTAALLALGLQRSPTMRALADMVEAGNVYVFIVVNPFARPGLSGALTWMTVAGGNRYVRVSLSPTEYADQAIATIAHELRHAVEVVEDATVVDESSLVALYRRIGRPSPAVPTLGWDTDAAREAGFQVRRELLATPASAIAQRADRATADKGSSDG